MEKKMKIASHELKAIIDYCIDKGREFENGDAALKKVIENKERDIKELEELVRKSTLIHIAPIAHNGEDDVNN